MLKLLKQIRPSRIVKRRTPAKVPTIQDIVYFVCIVVIGLSFLIEKITGSESISSVLDAVVLTVCIPFLCYDLYMWCKKLRTPTKNA